MKRKDIKKCIKSLRSYTNIIRGVLDVDSPLLSHFNNVDKEYLEKVIVKMIDIL